MNQNDGAVSPTNALLLADNASTRLYFRPNSNVDGPAALTLRAWDTTRGTAGTKVDPASFFDASAFSAASDVIDVTVTPIAPANTVPGAQTTLTNTNLVLSTANGNAISVSDVNPSLTVTLLPPTAPSLCQARPA